MSEPSNPAERSLEQTLVDVAAQLGRHFSPPGERKSRLMSSNTIRVYSANRKGVRGAIEPFHGVHIEIGMCRAALSAYDARTFARHVLTAADEAEATARLIGPAAEGPTT